MFTQIGIRINQTKMTAFFLSKRLLKKTVEMIFQQTVLQMEEEKPVFFARDCSLYLN